MNRKENAAVIESFFEHVRLSYGAQADEIIKNLVMAWGGLRITVPTKQDLERYERNERIKAQFAGFNHAELAERHGLKVRQIRRILHGK